MPRIPLQASINYLTPEIMAKGRVIDVSREGLRIESQDPVHVGMRLALVLYLSNDQEPVIIEDATVQWAIGTHFGVKFVKWSTNAEARLNNFFLDRDSGKMRIPIASHDGGGQDITHAESIDPQAMPLVATQRDLILRTLEECRWVIGGASGAATKLGMKRTSLQYRMKKLGITRTTRGSDN